MATVTVTQKPKPAQYESEIRVEFNGSGGVCSVVSWNNPDTLAAFSNLFELNPGEYLAAVVLNEQGIKAEIGRR